MNDKSLPEIQYFFVFWGEEVFVYKSEKGLK
jgi:hypothetical protein